MKSIYLKLAHCLILTLELSALRGVLCQETKEVFRDGCCLNASAFPRPKNVSQRTVLRRRLLEALRCETNDSQEDGTRGLARSLGNERALRVAYYFGTYLPQQESEALTIAIYSADGRRGSLHDVVWNGNDYYEANAADLRKARTHWRVGEINGGLWSYTRLWYLAQEIGSRPRERVSVKAILRSKPGSCQVGHPVWPTKIAP